MTWPGAISRVPNLRSADSRLVPGRSMRSRCSGYAAAASRRNRASRAFAACSPPRRSAGLRSMPSCSQVGMTATRARTSLGTGGSVRGGGNGLPIIAVSRKTRANWLNTEYGLPAPVRSVPGGISVSPSYRSSFAPSPMRRSRSRANGSTHRWATTRSAFHSRARRGTTSTLLPATTSRREPRSASAASRALSESSRNCMRCGSSRARTGAKK